MGIEIERKFLVKSDAWRTGEPVLFRQGYLNTDKKRTVRVRVAGNQAILTVKGAAQGISRAEFEYEIPVADANEMLNLCKGPLIEKNRWFFKADKVTWEIDEFLGLNAGLIVAEVELKSEDQTIELPNWVGEEVSHDDRYFNSSLSRIPFSMWETQ